MGLTAKWRQQTADMSGSDGATGITGVLFEEQDVLWQVLENAKDEVGTSVLLFAYVI